MWLPLLQESKKKFSKTLKGLVMACHTPPLEKAKKQEEAQLPALNPIPFRIQGSRMGNDTSPCFFAFLRGGLRLHFRSNVDGPNASAIKAICTSQWSL